MAAIDNDGEGSRYERVMRYLDAAHENSRSDYQGYGRFWRLPLAQFLSLRIYGVRMIAPPGEDLSSATPRQIAEHGSTAGEAPDDAGPVAAGDSGGGCCGTSGDSPAPRAEPGRGARSGLILGLKGRYPFDGTEFPPLMWGGGSRVPPARIEAIEQWIDAGCPESDEPHVTACADVGAGRATGEQAHPRLDGHVNDHRLALDAPRVRKNINCMTPGEFRRFQVAIAQMRRWDRYPADQRSWTYWAQIHANACQHGWEEFLPWHRAYLYEMERQMQEWDPGVALPYWSWTEYHEQNRALRGGPQGPIDNGYIPLRYGCWVTKEALEALGGTISPAWLNKLDAIQWDPTRPEQSVFMSGTRLLAAAGIEYPAQGDPAYQDVNRIFEQLAVTNPAWHRARWPGGGADYFSNYPSPEDVQRILANDSFFAFGSGPADNHYYGAVESIHNLIHNFSGGTNPNYQADIDAHGASEPNFGDMTSGAVTAYDPIFWGHHSNVDRLWWEWQQRHPGLYADNPDAVLPPWHYTVTDMRSITPLGYEYSLSTTHFPTDPDTFVTRFRSEKAQVPERALGLHRRAEVRLHGVRYLETPGVVRAYLNGERAGVDTHPRDSEHFVGELHIFQGQCVGGPGHCAPPPPRQTGDLRARHRKTPGNVRLDATQTVQRLLEKGETDFSVDLVVIDLQGRPAKDVLKLSSVSLDFMD